MAAIDFGLYVHCVAYQLVLCIVTLFNQTLSVVGIVWALNILVEDTREWLRAKYKISMISEEGLQNFISLYEKKYNLRLNRQEAFAMFEKLIGVVKIAYYGDER